MSTMYHSFSVKRTKRWIGQTLIWLPIKLPTYNNSYKLQRQKACT